MKNKKYVLSVFGILLILILIGIIYFKNKNISYTNNEKFYELLLTAEEYKIKGNYEQAKKTLEESLKYSKTGYYYLGML